MRDTYDLFTEQNYYLSFNEIKQFVSWYEWEC